MDQTPQHDTRFTESNRKTVLNSLAKKNSQQNTNRAGNKKNNEYTGSHQP